MTTVSSFVPTGFGEQIFKQRYAIHPGETWEEACKRISVFIANAEQNGKKVEWEERFYNELVTNRFIPGGRIMYGAGRPTSSLINCFVIGGTPDMDSRQGWAKYIGDMLIISSLGGGVGMSASTIRPRGTPIHGTGGEATGAVSFMQIVNSVAEEIRGGGGRRAALLFCLNMSHPDLPEFIDKKFINIDLDFTDPVLLSGFITEKLGVFDQKTIEAVKLAISQDTSGVVTEAIKLLFKAWLERSLRCANVSVLFDEDPEEFFAKVKKDELHEFKWKGQVVTRVKAKEVWEKIISNSMHSGEPGILNFYLANKMSNIHSVGPLTATNPSLRAGSLILTSEGVVPIEQLDGKELKVMNMLGEWKDAKAFMSGKDKTLWKVRLQNGREIFCTREHKWPVLLENGNISKKPTPELLHNDKLPIPIESLETPIDNKGCKFSKEDGFILGWNLGDGWITYHKVHKAMQYGFIFSKEDSSNGISKIIFDKINSLTKRDTNLRENKGALELVSTDSAVDYYFKSMQASHKRNGIPESIWSGSNEFIKGFIDGLFSSDGYVDSKRDRVILVTCHEKLAYDIRELLSFYGIVANVRKSRNTSTFPEEKYNTDKLYTRYDVKISNSNATRFSKLFSLSNKQKQEQLDIISQHKVSRKTGCASGYSLIDYVEETELNEDVYDITVFDDTHTFIVNGVSTGNCGEVTLSPNELCCLGQIVLSRFVTQNSKIDWEKLANTVHVAIRFLDNVLDATVYPTEEIKAKATSTRRIGLGITALHDTLLMCGLKYSSEEGRELAGKIMKFISNKSYEASAFLAVEKGTYPAFNPQDMETSGFIKGLKPSVRYMVKEKGIRNCALNSIAPTGTVSIVSGVSSGIEPIMGPAYKRMFWVGDKKETEIVVHPLFEKFVTEGRDVSHFEYGEEVQIKDHLEMQAVMQQYVDQSISKTIMLHKDVSKKKFSEYLMEYIPRVKGVTVYPVGSRGETPITPIPLKEAIAIVKDKKGRIGTSIEQETQDCPSGVCTLG